MRRFVRFGCFCVLWLLIGSAAVVYCQIPVPKPGTITTIAGTGAAGYSGDGGLATSAAFGPVPRIAVDKQGDVFFADTANNRIARVDAKTGVISTVAGTGVGGVFGRGGNWGDGGPASRAVVNAPWGIAIDGSGNLYITDRQNKVVRKVDAASGFISTVAGNPNWNSTQDQRLAINAVLTDPLDVAVDAAGNLLIVESAANIVQKVDLATGTIARMAGSGTAGYSGDGGAATEAQLYMPTSAAVDSAGNLLIADYGNNVIRMVSSKDGRISTIAGTGKSAYAGDGGPAARATLKWPQSVAVDAQANVYIGDYSNCIVRRISSSTGVIATIAGTASAEGVGDCGFAGDGSDATSAKLNQPLGMAVDGSGNVYIADSMNYRLRAVGSTASSANGIWVNVSSSDPNPTMGETITLRAAIVNSANLPVTSGTVRWFNGSRALGTSNVDASGTAALITTLEHGGDQLISAGFSGIGTNTGTLGLKVSGFALSSSEPGGVFLPSGQTANVSLNTQGFYGFADTVNFACTGMPAPGACALSAKSVKLTSGAPSGNVLLTIKTAGPGALTAGIAGASGMLFAGVMPFLVLLRGRKSARRAWGALSLSLLGVVAVLSGCGVSGAVKPTPAPISYVPAGTYTVTVTATAGSSVVQLPVMVTIK